jgi:hypothetical protein
MLSRRINIIDHSNNNLASMLNMIQQAHNQFHIDRKYHLPIQ